MSRNKDKHEGASGRTYHIMSEAERASGRRGGWTTLEVTGGVRALAPPLFQLTHLTALYLNDNSLQRIPTDINQLVNLHTLDISNNKLRSLPVELGDLIQLRELHLHNNYLRALPYELGRLFHLQLLGLQGNPLNKEMLSIYNDSNGTAKLITYMLDNLQVSATLPPQRPWIPLTRPNRTRPTCIFTVMCYNVLCDKYATRQMYGYCPSWALEWDYRKKGILDEIRHYSADLISLQEVETDQFYNFFLPELKQDGYDGIFSPKSRAKTMSESERKYVDGCAIFFRSAKFALVKEHLIEFNQLAMANSEGSDNMLNRVMPKDNIGLAALLKTKEAAWENGLPTDSSMIGQPILVCTAHIHWDPEFCDVKLIQTMMLSNELRTILDDSGRTLRLAGQRDNVQLLLCGDFNSLPDSGVVEFLSAGRVSSEHRDFKELGYATSLRRMPGSEHEFTHNFKLASAYSEDIMPYTNYTFDFKGIIDYIFYSKQTMTPLGLLGPLSQEWFREHKVVGCPHPHIPSGTYRWVPACLNQGSIPPGALRVGTDADGDEIYAGRAPHEGEIVPAKVIPNKNVCFISFCGEEILKDQFEVLVPTFFAWQFASNGELPPGAVNFGVTADGERLYYGRVTRDGLTTPGKIQPSHGCCYFPLDGGEQSSTEYECLVLI